MKKPSFPMHFGLFQGFQKYVFFLFPISERFRLIEDESVIKKQVDQRFIVFRHQFFCLIVRMDNEKMFSVFQKAYGI